MGKEQWPHKHWSRLAWECLGVPGGGMGQQWPAAGSGALAAAVLGGGVCWDKSSWRRAPLALPKRLQTPGLGRLRPNYREGVQPHPSAENWLRAWGEGDGWIHPTEDGWHHQLQGHGFEQTLGDSEGQGSLECCSPWGHKELDMTEQLNNNKIALYYCLKSGRVMPSALFFSLRIALAILRKTIFNVTSGFIFLLYV